MLDFQQLDVYKRSIELLALAVEVAPRVPRGNAELLDQLKRAATSIPLNIAEGAGRITRSDRARFWSIARGSAMESAAVLDTLRVLGVIDEAIHARAIDLLTRIVSMLTKMCR
jgi:four helix bundle protein